MLPSPLFLNRKVEKTFVVHLHMYVVVLYIVLRCGIVEIIPLSLKLCPSFIASFETPPYKTMPFDVVTAAPVASLL